MRLGAKDIELPLVPAKLVPLLRGAEPTPAAESCRRQHRATER